VRGESLRFFAHTIRANRVAENSRTRVLIVDDSAFMRTALASMVDSDPELHVVATAADGNDALKKVPAFDPDVVMLDMQMPGMDGLQTLREIMKRFPRPVIMVSSVTSRGADATLNALEAGAFDYLPKQLSNSSLDITHLRGDLIRKIKAAAQSWQVREEKFPPRKVSSAMISSPSHNSVPAIVAIGVSTGGPKALSEILPRFPADLPVPIVIVQHMPFGFTGPLAARLNNLSPIFISEAAHGDAIRPGTVYVAPAGSHLTVARGTAETVIRLSKMPEGQEHTPSIDVMMQSVASVYGSQAMGVIMTGMGSDGAQGMKAIHQKGGLTVGQDKESCAVYGMPRICAEMEVLDRIVPLSQIPEEILQATQYSKASAS
jgi:two-component system, chemotaxis family, protein-glutamate methylesterase/glutaminase